MELYCPCSTRSSDAPFSPRQDAASAIRLLCLLSSHFHPSILVPDLSCCHDDQTSSHDSPKTEVEGWSTDTDNDGGRERSKSTE